MIGGVFGILQRTGVITAAVGKLLGRLKHRGALLTVVMMAVFAVGGSTLGVGEEFIPLVPVFVLLARRLGYDALYGIAMVEAKQGKTKEALSRFNRVLNLSPNDPDILRDLGITHFNAGSAEAALAPLKKAHAIDPDDMETVLYLGRVSDALGDYTAALGFYQSYREKNPDSDSIYYNLAMTCGKMNATGDSHYNFGIFFKKKQKPKSALFHFEAALPHFPPDSERAAEITKEVEALRHGNGKGGHPPPGN